MKKIDYYNILQIDPKASLKTIKSAYRQMALKYHPDHNPNNEEAKKKFALIREAYELLSDPHGKAIYDKTYSPDPQTPKASESEKAEPYYETNPPKASSKNPSKNLRYNIYVTLEDVLEGTQKTIRYIRQGQKDKETIEVTVPIPRGAFHQQRLKLSHYGDFDGTQFADLFVIIHLHNHPIFLRKDLDIRVNVPITYLDALVGNTIDVPTLSGFKKIKLNPCVFEDIHFCLKGLGLPQTKNQFRGDLHVHCFIENPTKLGTQEKNALQKMSSTWPQGELMQQYQSYLQNHRRS